MAHHARPVTKTSKRMPGARADFAYVGGGRRRRLRPVFLVALASALSLSVLPLWSLTHSEKSNTAGAGTGAIRFRYTVPSSIDSTGSTDVTSALQRFLNLTPHHSQLDFKPGARYRIEGTLHLDERNDMAIDGKGATFFATQPTRNRNRSQWSFNNDSNLEIFNMTVRGANANAGQGDNAYVQDLEAQHGIEVTGGERISIHDVDIADTYGDFVYVSRSAGPVYGHPHDVHIYHNKMERNGRMGITVADGTNVLIDHNTINDTRRSTIDLEPYSPSGVVRSITIVENQIGPGRLNFVSGQGAGDVSDIVVAANTLRGHGMGIDLLGPDGSTRYGVIVAANVSDTQVASTRGSVMRFVNYQGVAVRNNVQPTPTNRQMAMVSAVSSCNVDVTGNDLSPGGIGQLKSSAPRTSCPADPPAPTNPANYFDGQQLKIDVGNTTDFATRCSDKWHCGGYLTSADPPTHIVTAPVINPTASQADRTMLMGNMDFSIPMRSGNYSVTMTFVEPVFKRLSQRRINVDAERVRVLNAIDPFEIAHGTNRVVRRTFRISVGDGALDIHLNSGSVLAVLSYITITRD
ncbi:MAG: hypothetical protein QOJ71_2391 [Actinomycetota bacterium]|nr:hypothetical protein [Actinomycetota bacterium]